MTVKWLWWLSALDKLNFRAHYNITLPYFTLLTNRATHLTSLTAVIQFCVIYTIEFQIETVMHAILDQRGPSYLNNIKFNTEESGRRHLRSSTTNAAVVMRTQTQFVKLAFSVCGPNIWNQIPPHIRNLHSVPAFRKALKTYLLSEII